MQVKQVNFQNGKVGKDLLRALGSASTDADVEVSPKDLLVIKRFAGDVQKCFASLKDLQDPFKSEFLRVKGDIDTMLASMTPSDQAPAALEANGVLRNLLFLLERSQEMLNNMAAVAKDANSRASLATASAENTIESKVEEKLQRQLAAGELIKKDDLQAKIQDAVKTAEEGWKKALELVGSRKKLLATASVPAPGDDALLGDEKDFNARLETAKARVTQLTPYAKVLGDDRILQLAWNTDQTAYDVQFGTISLFKPEAAASAATQKRGADGFASGTPAASDSKSTLRNKLGAM